MDQPYITLNNGVQLPQLGLGVWQTKNGKDVEQAVSWALKAGYRLIDTAAAYGNEAGVGNAIAASDITREEVFITTKLWNADQGHTKAVEAFQASKKRLGVDYIDLYLIHWPTPKLDKYIETWKALEELYAAGEIRAIGVCNFNEVHLETLLSQSSIVPAINQIELHPYFQQSQLQAFGSRHSITTEAYSPLGGSTSSLLSDPLLSSLGKKYNKSPAQIILRWHIQKGVVVIPKSSSQRRIHENINIFDFSLSENEITQINSLETGRRVGKDGSSFNLAPPTRAVQLAHKFGLVHW